VTAAERQPAASHLEVATPRLEVGATRPGSARDGCMVCGCGYSARGPDVAGWAACPRCGRAIEVTPAPRRGVAYLAIPAGARLCDWDFRPLARDARPYMRFCDKDCRQAWHRYRVRACGLGPDIRFRSMVFAYADPPYPGRADYYVEHQEVDHRGLVDGLVASHPDGWVLSTCSDALREVLPLCPPDVRVCSWLKKAFPVHSRRAIITWEPVIVWRGRPLEPGVVQDLRDARLDEVDGDALVAQGRYFRFPGALVGMKPPEFAVWMFRQLGARPGDRLDDLYPGSGAITRAWRMYTAAPPATVEPSRVDRASGPSAGVSASSSDGISVASAERDPSPRCHMKTSRKIEASAPAWDEDLHADLVKGLGEKGGYALAYALEEELRAKGRELPGPDAVRELGRRGAMVLRGSYLVATDAKRNRERLAKLGYSHDDRGGTTANFGEDELQELLDKLEDPASSSDGIAAARHRLYYGGWTRPDALVEVLTAPFSPDPSFDGPSSFVSEASLLEPGTRVAPDPRDAAAPPPPALVEPSRVDRASGPSASPAVASPPAIATPPVVADVGDDAEPATVAGRMEKWAAEGRARCPAKPMLDRADEVADVFGRVRERNGRPAFKREAALQAARDLIVSLGDREVEADRGQTALARALELAVPAARKLCARAEECAAGRTKAAMIARAVVTPACVAELVDVGDDVVPPGGRSPIATSAAVEARIAAEVVDEAERVTEKGPAQIGETARAILVKWGRPAHVRALLPELERRGVRIAGRDPARLARMLEGVIPNQGSVFFARAPGSLGDVCPDCGCRTIVHDAGWRGRDERGRSRKNAGGCGQCFVCSGAKSAKAVARRRRDATPGRPATARAGERERSASWCALCRTPDALRVLAPKDPRSVAICRSCEKITFAEEVRARLAGDPERRADERKRLGVGPWKVVDKDARRTWRFRNENEAEAAHSMLAKLRSARGLGYHFSTLTPSGFPKRGSSGPGQPAPRVTEKRKGVRIPLTPEGEAAAAEAKELEAAFEKAHAAEYREADEGGYDGPASRACDDLRDRLKANRRRQWLTRPPELVTLGEAVIAAFRVHVQKGGPGPAWALYTEASKRYERAGGNASLLNEFGVNEDDKVAALRRRAASRRPRGEGARASAPEPPAVPAGEAAKVCPRCKKPLEERKAGRGRPREYHDKCGAAERQARKRERDREGVGEPKTVAAEARRG
jgi:hypothetical protein